MAGSLNKVMLIGNVGRDVEVRHTQSGLMIVNLSVATSESWKDKSTGEKRERTEWHRVVIFNENLGKIAEQYIKKGSKVYIEGQIETRKWQDQSGQDRYSTEIILKPFNGTIVLLGDPNRQSSGDRYGSSSSYDDRGYEDRGRSAPAPAAAPAQAPATDMNDEIPF